MIQTTIAVSGARGIIRVKLNGCLVLMTRRTDIANLIGICGATLRVREITLAWIWRHIHTLLYLVNPYLHIPDRYRIVRYED